MFIDARFKLTWRPIILGFTWFFLFPENFRIDYKVVPQPLTQTFSSLCTDYVQQQVI